MNAHLSVKSRNVHFFMLFLIAITVYLPGVRAFAAVQEQNTSTPASQAMTNPAPAGPGTAPILPSVPPAPSVAVSSAAIMGLTCPPEFLPLIEKTTSALMSKDFTFYPVKALDPFIPFITPDIPPPVRFTDDDEEPVENDKPLTPLQKMTVAEIESGLKAIMWGELGRRAMVEDSAGKGYIVAVGTPAGERNGVIKEIQNDRLVIEQQLWNKIEKKKIQHDVIVKLVKKTDKTV
jgi:hypothetical protein